MKVLALAVFLNLCAPAAAMAAPASDAGDSQQQAPGTTLTAPVVTAQAAEGAVELS